jgi:hypothetical protein
MGSTSICLSIKDKEDPNMDEYEDHKDKRISELHRRMRKMGNKKNLTDGG